MPRSARACPECGADETAGWNEDRAVYDGLDLPDDEFDYEQYLEKEFSGTGAHRGKHHKLLTWLLLIGAAIAVLVFLRSL